MRAACCDLGRTYKLIAGRSTDGRDCFLEVTQTSLGNLLKLRDLAPPAIPLRPPLAVRLLRCSSLSPTSLAHSFFFWSSAEKQGPWAVANMATREGEEIVATLYVAALSQLDCGR